MSIKTQRLNSFETSTHPLLDSFYPDKKALQVDSAVQGRAEQIYHRTTVMRQIISNTAENPTRFGCSVIALIAGLSQMYSGDLISGGIATAIGAKELCNQSYKEPPKKIDLIQKELNEIKERNDDLMHLLSEMSSDIRKAKAKAQKKLDPSDVVIGFGAVMLFSSMGTVSAAVLGVTTAYAWHHGTAIANTTKKVYNYFLGTALPPRPMEKEQYVRVNMDERSSGCYGRWVKGRPSYTCGSVDIRIGDEIAQFRFDLNQSEYPLAKEDLFVLYSKMFTKLKDKTLSPTECKKVLHQLEHITIDRGGFHPVKYGLIGPMQAAYGLVKALQQY